MSNEGKKVKVLLSITADELESLRSFVDYSGGNILSVTKIRKRKCEAGEEDDLRESSVPCQSGNAREEEPSTSFVLGPLQDQECNHVRCNFCMQSPCVVASPSKPNSMNAHGPPRAQNISKRYNNYKYFYGTLKKAGLWQAEEYLNRKYELGIFIEDVREVLPNCVVIDVRKRWPNPEHIPYKGHVPIMGRD